MAGKLNVPNLVGSMRSREAWGSVGKNGMLSSAPFVTDELSDGNIIMREWLIQPSSTGQRILGIFFL